MYATLHRTSGPSTTEGDDPEPALRLRQIGGPIELAVRLWAEPPGDPDAYEVLIDEPLSEPGATPEVAGVVTFTGPISEAVHAAAERAYRDRIAPGMADHPGGVRMLGLWQPELRRQILITLATSVESWEEGGKKIGSMPLLPGEDVALLPGPDHVELFRVES